MEGNIYNSDVPYDLDSQICHLAASLPFRIWIEMLVTGSGYLRVNSSFEVQGPPSLIAPELKYKFPRPRLHSCSCPCILPHETWFWS